jgi:hypothetical protein
MVRGMLAKKNHLVTRVKSNSVAYFPAPRQPSNRPRRRGRPKKYGNEILVAALLRTDRKTPASAQPRLWRAGGHTPHPLCRPVWRPVVILVRFVAVSHPRRGTILLMSTDMTLNPLDIIKVIGAEALELAPYLVCLKSTSLK